MTDPYATEQESEALLQKTEANVHKKYLDHLLDVNGANEQGAETFPILYNIALFILANRTAIRSDTEDIQIDEWNGLTDKAKLALVRAAPKLTVLELIEAVEEELRIKNK
jgi:hypothetical protein